MLMFVGGLHAYKLRRQLAHRHKMEPVLLISQCVKQR